MKIKEITIKISDEKTVVITPAAVQRTIYIVIAVVAVAAQVPSLRGRWVAPESGLASLRPKGAVGEKKCYVSCCKDTNLFRNGLTLS